MECFTEIRENVTVPEPVSHRLGHSTSAAPMGKRRRHSGVHLL
jgi:hypothetical protein